MQQERLPWQEDYQFVGSNITPDGIRVYPFDPAFPVDVRFVTGGRRLVRMNRHEFFEVIYIYNGSLEIQIRDRRFRLIKGDVVVIGAHIYHQLLYAPNVKAKVVSLNYQPEVIRSGAAEDEAEIYLSSFLCQGPKFPHVISGRKGYSREMFPLMLKVHKELPARTALNRLAAKTYLKELLMLLVKHYSSYLETQEVIGRKQRDVDRLLPLFQLLDERFGQHIEVRDAARACAMSTSYFMRFFKLTTGQSFRAYLTAFRIAKAQSILSSGNTSIAEISQHVGFCSQSYFGEVFRGLVGMTPRAFRQRFGTKFKSK